MRTAFQEKFRNVLRLLDTGDLVAASAAAECLAPSGRVEQRMTEHARAKILMRQSRYVAALAAIDCARAEWGEHVGLTADAAACHYALGDPEGLSLETERLATAFRSVREVLSTDSFFRTVIMIAKLEEERGRLAVALEYYESAHAAFVPGGPRSSASAPAFASAPATGAASAADEAEREARRFGAILVLTQLLRVRALYEPTERLGLLYHKLLKMRSGLADPDTDIEIEHSLMQAELVLVGPASAAERLHLVLDRVDAHPADKRLVFYDYLEACLRRGEVKQLERLRQRTAAIPAISDELDPYEAGLFALAFKTEWRPSASEIDQLLSQCSLASALRLMTLVCRTHGGGGGIGGEIKRKILLLLSGLDSGSRELWLRFFNDVIGAGSIEVVLDPAGMRVLADGREISLARRKTLFALLEALAREPRLEIAEACRILWNCDYNPSYYHRLRMAAARLNEILFSVTEKPKSVQVDLQSVRLDQALRLRVIA